MTGTIFRTGCVAESSQYTNKLEMRLDWRSKVRLNHEKPPGFGLLLPC